MNYSSIRRIMGLILQFEAGFLLLPCAAALIYRETEGLAYLAVAAVCAVLGTLLVYFNRNDETYYTKEGFVAVALSWIVLSVFGAEVSPNRGAPPSPSEYFRRVSVDVDRVSVSPFSVRLRA